ncbi:MAG: hypothetical protein CM15mP10_2800 [Actinomycetota bacterium]|nr:MAG: hypothetical protein CM15mP10_2800 [Actinomycetota bacterium]
MNGNKYKVKRKLLSFLTLLGKLGIRFENNKPDSRVSIGMMYLLEN